MPNELRRQRRWDEVYPILHEMKNILDRMENELLIYRNQSYFLGSVKSAKRFARLVSLTQSAKNCKRNVQKYFHDILNRVLVTVKDEMVSILPHKWAEPVTIPLVY